MADFALSDQDGPKVWMTTTPIVLTALVPKKGRNAAIRVVHRSLLRCLSSVETTISPPRGPRLYPPDSQRKIIFYLLSRGNRNVPFGRGRRPTAAPMPILSASLYLSCLEVP